MKVKKIKKVICLLCASVLFLSQTTINAATYSVSVTKYAQEKSNWCWVACAKMCGNYYGYSYTQSNICNYVKGNTHNDTCSLTEQTQALTYTTHKNVLLSWASPFDMHVYQLQHRNLSVIAMVWTNGDSHVYVVSGAKEASGPALDSLYLIDPISGVSNTYVSYSSLINGATLASGRGTYTYSWLIN